MEKNQVLVERRLPYTPFCKYLKTTPCPDKGTILVTGASGYVGGRLVPELLERGYKVRVLVRRYCQDHHQRWPNVEIVVGDALDYISLKKSLQGVYAAYYLIHSMLLGESKFEDVDIKSAINFRNAAQDNNVSRIIYLGGLGEAGTNLSKHLSNRIEVANQLGAGKVKLTTLRAAIIIGSGSASYEIIKSLSQKLPFMILPKWANNLCQPISIRDVLMYLVGVLESSDTTGKAFDIGGKDVLTYKEMIQIFVSILGRKVIFLPVFTKSIRRFGYFTSLITPVPAKLVRCLFESLKNDVICLNHDIKNYVPFEPTDYETSVKNALTWETMNNVETRWSDSYPKNYCYAPKLDELPLPPKYSVTHSLVTAKRNDDIFRSFCRVGGQDGWFHGNWLWRFRGMIDRILLGVGSARGKKHNKRLRINDVIDFWRIEDIQKNKRLLLRSEMKLPGMAWLEFNVAKLGARNELSIIAYYDTNSCWGKAYWYLCLPLHKFIFSNLIMQIEKRSGSF